MQGSGSAFGLGKNGWEAGYKARMQVDGAEEVTEGFTWRNVLGSCVHLHFGSCPQLAASLVARCREVDVGAINAAVAKAHKQVQLSGREATPRRPSSSLHSKIISKLFCTCKLA